MTDFDQLRLEVERAWLAFNRDDREPLRELLWHLVDAIEAVSPPAEWTMDMLTLPELQAKLGALCSPPSTERREREQ